MLKMAKKEGRKMRPKGCLALFLALVGGGIFYYCLFANTRMTAGLYLAILAALVAIIGFWSLVSSPIQTQNKLLAFMVILIMIVVIGIIFLAFSLPAALLLGI